MPLFSDGKIYVIHVLFDWTDIVIVDVFLGVNMIACTGLCNQKNVIQKPNKKLNAKKRNEKLTANYIESCALRVRNEIEFSFADFFLKAFHQSIRFFQSYREIIFYYIAVKCRGQKFSLRVPFVTCNLHKYISFPNWKVYFNIIFLWWVYFWKHLFITLLQWVIKRVYNWLLHHLYLTNRQCKCIHKSQVNFR